MCHFWGEVLKGPCACSACALLQGPWRSLKGSRQVPKPSHMCVTSKPSEPQAAAISETVGAVGAATLTPLEQRFLMPRPRPSPTNTGMVRFQGQRPGHGLSEPQQRPRGRDGSVSYQAPGQLCVPAGASPESDRGGGACWGWSDEGRPHGRSRFHKSGRFLPTVL